MIVESICLRVSASDVSLLWRVSARFAIEASSARWVARASTIAGPVRGEASSFAAKASRSERFAASAAAGSAKTDRALWKASIWDSLRWASAVVSTTDFSAWVLIAAAAQIFSCARRDLIFAVADSTSWWIFSEGLRASAAAFRAVSTWARVGAILAFAASRVLVAACSAVAAFSIPAGFDDFAGGSALDRCRVVGKVEAALGFIGVVTVQAGLLEDRQDVVVIGGLLLGEEKR